MTEYIEQSSASDRYEAARALLADWDKAATPDALGLHDAGGFAMRTNVTIRETLRALITPPGVGESDEEIAARVMQSIPFRTTVIGDHVCLAEGMLTDLAVAAVRAGIQNAHETWEPEVAMQPSQEQMLRWLGLESREGNRYMDGEVTASIHILDQWIEREEF